MMDKTNLSERIAKLEANTQAFQKDIRMTVIEIRTDLRELLARSNQQIGERNLARLLIGLLGAVSGGIAGWLTHFWWMR